MDTEELKYMSSENLMVNENSYQMVFGFWF